MKTNAPIPTLIISTMLSVSAPHGWGAEAGDSVRSLNEVVVTGTNQRIEENLLPYTVSVVSDRQLNASGKSQVLSAISGMVPSLFVSERSVFGFGVSNGGSGQIKLRGIGGDNGSILMLVDGQPQFAGIYSHHVADIYGKDYVDRVEVLRGPGSVLYGSNAMAGAINVITKNAQKRGVRTIIESQYGSKNTWLSSIYNTTRFGKFSSLVSLSYNRSDGTQKHFDFKMANGYAKVGYDFSDNWRGYLDYTLMNFRGNDPIYAKLSNPQSTDIYHQNITRGETSATMINNYGDISGTTRVYYNYGNHFITDPRYFHSLDQRFGLTTFENFKAWTGSRFCLGFDFDFYSGKIPVSGGKPLSAENMGTIGYKRVMEYSPYITLSQTLFDNLINLNAGLRLALSDRFKTQWIPQFGFSINPGEEWTIKGNLAMGFRNPSFKDLYLYRTANPNLEQEKMMNYEISVGKEFSRYFAITLTAYYSKGDNMIQVVDMKNQNTGRFINKGIEIAARSNPLDDFWINASYSYLHTSLDNLTCAPKNQYYLGIEWRPWTFIDIAADVKGVGGLYVGKDTPNQNYALLNLKITYDICKYISIFANLENLADVRYTINRGYEMPGFTALGGFKLTF